MYIHLLLDIKWHATLGQAHLVIAPSISTVLHSGPPFQGDAPNCTQP